MLNWLKTLPARTLALLRAGLEKMKRGSLSLFRPGLERIKRDGPPLFRSGLERVKRDGSPLLHAGLERIKRVDLSLARSWLGRGKRDGLQVGVGLTVVYLLVILLLRGSDVLALVWEGNLNELGDFLAGVFTPLAFLWLVLGYFMQHTELALQREELKHQREELAMQREKLGEQVELLQEQVRAEDERSLPHLKLELGASTDEQQFCRIRNTVGTATDLEVARDCTDQELFRLYVQGKYDPGSPMAKEELARRWNVANKAGSRFILRKKTQLGTHDDDILEFTIPRLPPPEPLYCEVRFNSNHSGRRYYQRWKIEQGVPPTRIQWEELTNGSTPLEEA